MTATVTSLDSGQQLRFDGFEVVDVKGKIAAMALPLMDEPVQLHEELTIQVRVRCIASRHETHRDARGNPVVVLKQFFHPVQAEIVE